MNKYVFLYQGYNEPTQEIMDAWMGWFATIGDSIVDSGNPFAAGREVTPTGSTDLPLGPESTTGYTIVNAENMDSAQKLLDDCPIIGSVRIYETASM
jgi:hypothetical protein